MSTTRITVDPELKALRHKLHEWSVEQLKALRGEPYLNRADKALLTRYIHMKQNPAAYSMNPAQKKASAINYMLHALGGAEGAMRVAQYRVEVTHNRTQAATEDCAHYLEQAMKMVYTSVRAAKEAANYLRAYNAEKVEAGKAKKNAGPDNS
jgi:hypothetical protein